MKKHIWILIILFTLSIIGCTVGEPISIFTHKIDLTKLNTQGEQHLHKIISTYKPDNQNIISIIMNNGMKHDEFFQKNEIALFYRYSETSKASVSTEVKIYNNKQERKATAYDEAEFTSVDSDLPSYLGVAFTAKHKRTQPEIAIYLAIADDFEQFVENNK